MANFLGGDLLKEDYTLSSITPDLILKKLIEIWAFLINNFNFILQKGEKNDAR